jgi:hypothetical protein
VRLRHIVALVVVCATVFAADAQITLGNTEFAASPLGADTMRYLAAHSPVPSFAPAINGIWDFSVSIDSPLNQLNFRVPTSGYQFADSLQMLLAVYPYSAKFVKNTLTSGIYEYGCEIQRSAYTLGPITANVYDSLTINAQNILYSSPKNQLCFPATYGTTWQSSYYSDMALNIKLQAYSWNNFPAIIRSYLTEYDTVVGWGQMRVNNNSGLPSSYFNVLQVNSVSFKTDSFFLNGAVAPSTFPLILHSYQGKKDTSYRQKFYRTGEEIPFAEATFSDGSYTEPTEVLIHQQHLINAVKLIAADKKFNVFPNPTSRPIFNIKIPEDRAIWVYKIFTMSGQLIQEGNLQGGINPQQLFEHPQSGSVMVGVYRNSSCVGFTVLQVVE